MEHYFLLKTLHILSATVLIGSGAGIAFFMLMAWLSKDPAAIRVTTRHVVLADWIFTAPAVVVQLFSGLLLMQGLGYAFDSQWFIRVISLFILIGCCWLPVVVIQYKLRSIAATLPLDERQFSFWMRIWVSLGIPAFISIVMLLYLMVYKPLPVS
ncbi:DUF2269 family protein [Bacterioplanoides pacificum]|uniref:DUF2269 family protein n=1 Tax=Bacterioplanoides pacificum TaxID=1171596 RepID=A0ABV7VS35_9GAMM